MKIIERGTLPADREWKATCTNCRTRVECLQSEGVVKSDQREGTWIEVVCPVCGCLCYGSPK